MKLLRIDLSKRKSSNERIRENAVCALIGGKGLRGWDSDGRSKTIGKKSIVMERIAKKKGVVGKRARKAARH